MERFDPEEFPVIDPSPSFAKIVYNFRTKDIVMIPIIGVGFAVSAFMFGEFLWEVILSSTRKLKNGNYYSESNIRIIIATTLPQ